MGRHKNGAQEAIMVNFMQEYSDLACGTLQNKTVRNGLWTMLANKLNSRGPPKKPPERWKKVWFDWRSAVKRKIMYEKSEAGVAEPDDVPYKKTSLSAIEYDVARICRFFDADGDIDESSDIQEDINPLSEGVVNIIKEELMLDEEDDANPIDCDVATDACEDNSNENMKSPGDGRISVRTFANCQSSTSKAKNDVKSSEVNLGAKRPKMDLAENNDNEELTQLLKQQTSVISAVAKFLTENANLHTENLRVMKELRQGLKEMAESINKLNEATNDKVKEQRRHNYEIEKLRRQEILLQKQQLELNEVKVFGNRKDEYIPSHSRSSSSPS